MTAKASKNEAPKGANKRGAARLAAVQALYQMDLSGTGLAEIVAEYENARLGQTVDGDQYREADAAYFRSILAGVIESQREIDPEIHSALNDDWPLSRIDTTLRAVLRCGAFELMRRSDVPARVIITEYVDVAKAFFELEETRLVNGVLDQLARRYRTSEFTA
ncbi:MAG: transcription antitermination factor NusB [Pseudomonadota bacterium]